MRRVVLSVVIALVLVTLPGFCSSQDACESPGRMVINGDLRASIRSEHAGTLCLKLLMHPLQIGFAPGMQIEDLLPVGCRHLPPRARAGRGRSCAGESGD